MPLDRRYYDLPDGKLSAVHFNGHAGSPKIVLCNANGFNALSYRAALEPMDVHAVALDFRGHGMSELPTDPASLRNWHIFRDDLIHFFKTYIDAPVLLVGHSFGAVSAILASADIQNKIVGFVGFDPVTIPFMARIWSYLPGGRAFLKRALPIARNAGRRRSTFETIDDVFERYQGRGAFKVMSDEVLRDYLEGGLVKDGDGYRLACDPLWEQAIYAAQCHNIFKGARGLPENSILIYAGKTAVSSPATRAAIQKNMSGGTVEFQPEFHHLFPFNRPEVARTYIQTYLTRANLYP